MVSAFQALREFTIRDPGLRSSDSLQPGLSHDGLSALKLRAQNRSERVAMQEVAGDFMVFAAITRCDRRPVALRRNWNSDGDGVRPSSGAASVDANERVRKTGGFQRTVW